MCRRQGLSISQWVSVSVFENQGVKVNVFFLYDLPLYCKTALHLAQTLEQKRLNEVQFLEKNLTSQKGQSRAIQENTNAR